MGFRFFTGSRQIKSMWRDRFNIPLHGMFIPDVHNIFFRYIIEVDGSYHDRADQKELDARKDGFYRKWGFTCFRVKAYDELGLIDVLNGVQKMRDAKFHKLPKRAKKYLNRVGY